MKFKSLILSLFLTLSSCSSPREKSQGFSPRMLAAPLSIAPKWKQRPPTQEEEEAISQALSQNYTFLGSGGQCSTFESADGLYVIKFFKQKAFALPDWIDDFPLQWLISPFKAAEFAKTERKKSKAFSPFALCYDQLPEETGILYIHLLPSELDSELTFVGPDKNPYQIPLKKFAFVVQKKANLALETIGAQYARGDRRGAIQAIDDLLQLHIRLYKRGIRNRDANFRSNCGFIGQRPIIIDVGRIVYTETVKRPENYKRELERFLPRFRRWLVANQPDLILPFEEIVAKIMECEE